MKKNALFIGLLTVGLVFSLRLSAQSVSYKECLCFRENGQTLKVNNK
jgi:hypothetical protein